MHPLSHRTPPGSTPSPSRRSARRAAAGVACAALLLCWAGAADAAPSATPEAEAARIEQSLRDSGERITVLAETFDQHRISAADAEAEAEAARKALAEADQRLQVVRARMRRAATLEYMSSSVPLVAGGLLDTGDAAEASVRQAYLAEASGDVSAALADLKRARNRLDTSESRLDTARTAEATSSAALSASHGRIEQAVQARAQTLALVTPELAPLVAQVKAERDAQEEALAEQRYLERLEEQRGTSTTTVIDDGQMAEERVDWTSSTTAGVSTTTARVATTSTTARATTTTAKPTTTTKPKQTTTTSKPSSGGTAPVSPGADRAVAEARRHLGKPYEYGADGPNTFDCSGLTMVAWRAGGVSLPHSSAQQYKGGRKVSTDHMVPGDLVFFGDGGQVSHVGIYIGGGQMIAAPRTGDVVKIQNVWRDNLIGATRPY